jgi:hypothetical protein
MNLVDLLDQRLVLSGCHSSVLAGRPTMLTNI